MSLNACKSLLKLEVAIGGKKTKSFNISQRFILLTMESAKDFIFKLLTFENKRD